MESQTSVSKRAPREFRNWRMQGDPLTLRQPFANPSPTLRQPFANLSPTLRQPFLPTPPQALFPWAPGTRLETRVNGFLELGLKQPGLGTPQGWQNPPDPLDLP